MPLRYLVGDATQPVGTDTRVICHCVNDQGQWGSGFVLAINARWKHVERLYREWHRSGNSARAVDLIDLTQPGPSTDIAYFHLGSVQYVQVEPKLWIANIVGQHKTIREIAVPVRYDALEYGFRDVAAFCKAKYASAHMPRLGAGLAKGRWSKIAAIIEAQLVAQGVLATVYDLAT